MHFLSNFRKLLLIVDKTYLSLTFLFLIFFFSGILDLIGLSIIFPYLQTVLNQEEMGGVFSDNFFLKFLNNFDSENLLRNLTLVLIFIFFLKMIVSIVIKTLINSFVYKNIASLQVKLLKSYLKLEYSDFLKDMPSTYVRNIREFSTNCLQSLQAYLTILSEFIILSIVMLYLFYIDFLSVIIIIIFTSTLAITYSIFFRPLLNKFGEKRVNAIKAVYKIILEGISGFKEINILKKEKFFLNTIKTKADDIYINEVKASVISFSPRYVVEFMLILFIICYLSISLAMGKDLKYIVPIIGVFGVAGLRILPGTSAILHNITIINFITPIVNIIYNILKSDNEKIKIKKKYNQNIPAILNKIEFKKINFKYENSDLKILNNVNFKIEQGEFIGIHGDTGKGKSTLIDIVLGFHKNFDGEIFLNNKKINHDDYRIFLQSNVSYVPQKPFIISDSIITNITLENIDEKINHQRLDQTLKHFFIDKLFAKRKINLKTVIGEDGTQLSGGETQKINLARGFYNAGKLLILDEATNQLDEETERKIIQNLKNQNKNCSIILVTHSKSNLDYCDRVINL